MHNHLQQIAILLIILSIAVSCQSCKDDKHETETVCTPDNTVLVPQDMKDRFFFKEGTYWIYKNLQTHETDSIWVLSYRDETFSADKLEPGSNIKNKCYQAIVNLVTNKTFYEKGTFLTNYANNLIVTSGNKEVFGINEISKLAHTSVIYRIDYIDHLYSNINGGAEAELIDSILTQDNRLFKNLLHLKYPTGKLTNDYLDDMYYAKNIGLVKFHRFTDSSNWELMRSHIIQ